MLVSFPVRLMKWKVVTNTSFSGMQESEAI
jgi:hypothetical protein